jgi:TonB family protein
MRRLFAWPLSLLLFPSLNAQTPPPPQTARQALIEMFFGTAPNHLEKHLPDTTRNAFKRMSGANGMSMLDEFSMFANMTKAGGTKLETFDTGPTLLQAEGPEQNEKVELTVEGDNLSGDEDQIEISVHVTKDANEQTLPFIPRFTFAMKTEADIWRLNEISVAVRVPLEDPDFLKTIQQQSNKENEQGALWGVQNIIGAENSYHSAHGVYVCSLSELAAKGKRSNGGQPSPGGLFGDIATGKHTGYVYVISGCDGTQYKVVAEPELPDSGQRAFCSDESGATRAAADGKATTCLSNGEAVSAEAIAGEHATGLAVAVGGGEPNPHPQPDAKSRSVTKPQTAGSAPQGVRPLRVRVSQGVTQGMVISKVAPSYPPDARAARIQGSVVMAVVIGKDGNVQQVSLVSGHPMLAPAAIDSVKQWKYRPYILNGTPVGVETQITVNFTLTSN